MHRWAFAVKRLEIRACELYCCDIYDVWGMAVCGQPFFCFVQSDEKCVENFAAHGGNVRFIQKRAARI
ncbi:MAG TPA: hypothetical protein DHV89_13380 [Ruminococcus sp.]|nr:hypothetical protein [Ruminococcus sp.]